MTKHIVLVIMAIFAAFNLCAAETNPTVINLSVTYRSAPTFPFEVPIVPAQGWVIWHIYADPPDDLEMSPNAVPQFLTITNHYLYLEWNAHHSLTYEIEASNDMQSWDIISPIIMANDRAYYFAPVKIKKTFYRVIMRELKLLR